MSNTFVVTDALDDFVRKYELYTGLSANRQDRACHFSFALGTQLTIIDAKHASAYLPGTLFPPLPAIAGIVFRCPSLSDQRQRLTKWRVCLR